MTAAVLVLGGWSAGGPPAIAEDAELSATVATLSRRVAQLEAALASRNSAPPASVSQVTAPFEVVDKVGNVILRVTDAPHALVVDRHARVTIARGGAENYILHFRRLAGQIAASVGEQNTGAGSVWVGDGQTSSGTTVLRGNEGVSVYNQSGKEVAGLSRGSGGAGQLHLMDANGQTTVEAGTLSSDGTGVVRVGPEYKCSGYGGIRMPDCIKGRPAGQ